MITIHLTPDRKTYFPGQVLSCEYEIDLSKGNREKNRQASPAVVAETKEAEVTAVETSVIWQTIGKGDEDMGVHFFERREKKNVLPELLRQTHKLNTVLPQSPLSYDGEILSIQWCVRVRVFFQREAIITEDQLFRLG